MKSILKISLLSIFVMTAFQSINAQKKVQSFTVSNVINASADQVWAIVAEDYGAVANSHPKIISSDYINGSLKGELGAQRVCYFNEDGSQYLKEEIADLDAENYVLVNQVFQAGKFPVDPEYTKGIYKVVPIDENTSRFDFEMYYRTKPAFLGGLMKNNFKKLINDYAVAINHHLTTGENVNKDNFKTIKKAYAAR